MRFPVSADDALPLRRPALARVRALPQPARPRVGLQHGGRPRAARRTMRRPLDDLPPLFRRRWPTRGDSALDASCISAACRTRSALATRTASRRSGTPLVGRWDDRSFYEFVASSDEFSNLSFRHREVFGQVGFGTGGWDTDFPNSMLEILRVVVTELRHRPAAHRRRRRAGACGASGGAGHGRRPHWPAGTAWRAHGGAPRPSVTATRPQRIGRRLAVTDASGDDAAYRRVSGHLPELAADHADRLRREPVLAEAVDGARPHPLHAVVEDLRDGRPAVLEGLDPPPAAT